MKTKLLFVALFFSVQFASAQILTIRVWLEGYYITSTHVMRTPLGDQTFGNPDMSDFVTISLYDDVNCALVQRVTSGVLFKNGYVTISCTNISNGSNYWIRVQHKNHVEVWSYAAIPLYTSGSNFYDFTSPSAGGAYSDSYSPDPQAYLETYQGVDRWGMYAGDIDQDGGVTSLDMTIEESASNIGAYGFIVEDINGDGSANSLDMTLIENNVNIAVWQERPSLCEFAARKANPNNITFENSMEISVRPNPSHDNIEVVTNKDQCLLKFTNTVGEIVYEERMDYQTNIKVANFPKGIYFLTIERNGNVEGKKKIAVQ